MFIKGREPLTMFGIVVVAVALRLVPNCSAPIVIKIIQKPELNPNIAQIIAIEVLLVLKPLKNSMMLSEHNV